MARRAFFSFHYEHDIWRANVVRNSWVTQDRVAAGFFDASLWEEAKGKSDRAIRSLIDAGLIGTSVTVVLIGRHTAGREYVQYEIEQSIARGNGLLGIHIENIGDRNGATDPTGLSPLPSGTATYWWHQGKGHENLGTWIEIAARLAGR